MSIEEAPESADGPPPLLHGNQATTPMPSDESIANSGSSRKKWIWAGLGVVLFIGAISVALVWWVISQRYVLSDADAHTEIILKVQPQDDPDEPGRKLMITDESIRITAEILKSRLKTLGVKHTIEQVSTDLISVKLPALSQSDREEVQELIQRIGKLDFRLSHPNSMALVDAKASRVRGAELMKYEQEDPDGKKVEYAYFIERKITLSGSHIKSASVQRNPLTGVPEIHFTLDSIGASQFAKITERHQVGKPDPRLLAIVLDGKLVSAPSINGRIHARGQFTGDFTEDEANKIASSLNNPLEYPVRIIEVKQLK